MLFYWDSPLPAGPHRLRTPSTGTPAATTPHGRLCRGLLPPERSPPRLWPGHPQGQPHSHGELHEGVAETLPQGRQAKLGLEGSNWRQHCSGILEGPASGLRERTRGMAHGRLPLPLQKTSGWPSDSVPREAMTGGARPGAPSRRSEGPTLPAILSATPLPSAPNTATACP